MGAVEILGIARLVCKCRLLNLYNARCKRILLEKEAANIQWFKEGELRIRVQSNDDKSVVSVALNNENLCLTLAMYDFIDRIKDDILLDVTFSRHWNNHLSITIDASNAIELVHYIAQFIKEWNIGTGKNIKRSTDLIPYEQWYECL